MSEYTAALNGVTIGGTSPYRWSTVPQGLGHGSMRSARVAMVYSDGVRVVGPDTVAPRLITFDLWWDASTPAEAEQYARALAAAWAPTRSGLTTLELTVVDADYITYGRPHTFDLDLSTTYVGHARARCVFESTDPRFYSAAASSLVLGLATGGGVTAPVTAPVTAGAGSDSDGIADNAGNTSASWTATILGPVTTPRLTLGETGEFMELDGTVPSGSTLIVDAATQSVLLNGVPRPQWQTLLSRWWSLETGSNTVRFRAASGTGSCTFAWRSAWL